MAAHLPGVSMTDEARIEEIENKEKVRTFAETYKGLIVSVGVGERQVFAGVNYQTMVAQVWEPGSNAMVTLEVCDNKRSSWARDPQPLPLTALVTDLSNTIRNALHDAEEREDKARELEEELRVKALPAKGKFVRVHDGPHSGTYGMVFWSNSSRVGITTTMEKEKDEKFKAPGYKDPIWCEVSDVTVLLQITPRKGSKELALLFRYAPHVLGHLCGTPVVDFEALWSKVKNRPACLALMYAYALRSSDLRRYGNVWSLAQRVEGDSLLLQHLTLAVEKSDPAHFNAPWFPVSLRAMVEATFPPGEVTAA